MKHLSEFDWHFDSQVVISLRYLSLISIEYMNLGFYLVITMTAPMACDSV